MLRFCRNARGLTWQDVVLYAFLWHSRTDAVILRRFTNKTKQQTIMRKFFNLVAIAAVALTTVCTFASCGDDDDEDFPSSSETHKGDKKDVFVYSFFAGKDVLALGEIVINVEEDGKVTKHYVAQGESDALRYVDSNKEVRTFTGKTLKMNVNSGSKVSPEFVPNEAAFAALPTGGHTDLVMILDMTNSKSSIEFSGVDNRRDMTMLGLDNSKVLTFINQKFGMSSMVAK